MFNDPYLKSLTFHKDLIQNSAYAICLKDHQVSSGTRTGSGRSQNLDASLLKVKCDTQYRSNELQVMTLEDMLKDPELAALMKDLD